MLKLPGRRYIRSPFENGAIDETTKRHEIVDLPSARATDKATGLSQDNGNRQSARQETTAESKTKQAQGGKITGHPTLHLDNGKQQPSNNNNTSSKNIQDLLSEQSLQSIQDILLLPNNSLSAQANMQVLTQQRKRQNRQNNSIKKSLPNVKIHNIISGLPKPEIEMLYAVYQG